MTNSINLHQQSEPFLHCRMEELAFEYENWFERLNDTKFIKIRLFWIEARLIVIIDVCVHFTISFSKKIYWSYACTSVGCRLTLNHVNPIYNYSTNKNCRTHEWCIKHSFSHWFDKRDILKSNNKGGWTHWNRNNSN